jgi:hypothetical protein
LSKIEVNTVAPQCGTTLTLGESGDTVTLGSGASQSGFGRTGTVDWDTTAKTASFTAVSGNGYFVNTTSGSITVTLPATPSAGDIVGIKDYAGTFGTNNVTVARNGSNFDGVATNATLNTNQLSVFFVYVDGTQGWKATQNDSGSYGALFITATGGTVTCCGDYKIHTFTSPGTFTVTCSGNAAGSNSVDYMVVAGGGGGGFDAGGGGGGGGFRESSGAASGCYTASPLGACVSALPVTAQGYPITVGGGGPGGTVPTPGSNSIFSSITSTGGGGGARNPGISPDNAGAPGGSGGGSRASCASAGSGNTPPVSPPQGNPGGVGDAGGGAGGGGGGGASASGTTSAGGNGATTSISFSPTAYAGGGGGGPADPGGTGGGGNSGSNGTANTGGGGGGGSTPCGPAPNGGSGIVIIRYKFQ